MVYVLNCIGQPIMPTKDYRKVRLLLKNKQAKVIKRTPFTIQLLKRTKTYVQPIILGVDAGSKTVGLSATTKYIEVFSGELTLRNNIVGLLAERKNLRRSRRNRKTRYRKPRFNNRKSSKPKGWLAPSIRVKIQEHITIINRLTKILPISKIVVEVGEFDSQKIKAILTNKETPSGIEYQQGEVFGFYNARQYVLWRDNYTCQCCKKHGNGIKFHIHHLESRATGGNSPNNLITLCEDCHTKFHKGVISLDKLKRRKIPSMRDSAFMGIMRNFLIISLRKKFKIPVVETKGYITKYTRVEFLKLEKTHYNDALAIALGEQGFQINSLYTPKRNSKVFLITAVRHHNRQIHKANFLPGGIHKINQAPKYLYNFRLFDKVLYEGKEYFIWGRRTSGSFLLKTLNGESKNVSYKKLKLLERGSNYLIA